MPGAVGFELLGGVHVLSHMRRPPGREDAIGAAVVPTIPLVEIGGGKRLDAGVLAATNDRLLATVDRAVTRTLDRHLRSSAAADDEGRCDFVDPGAVVARPLDRKGRVRRIDLHGMAWGEGTDVDRGVAGGDAHLEEVGLLGRDTQLTVFSGAHPGARADLELQIAAGAGVELVPGRQRKVDLGGRPVVGARTPKRHFTFEKTQSGRGSSHRLGGEVICGPESWRGNGRNAGDHRHEDE